MPRNKTLARQWFEKAAALGNPQAKQNLKWTGR
jgi:TPR repeat protein